MMTEKEAKQKWCPFVREEVMPGEPFMGQPRCIGSACMAWRTIIETNNRQADSGPPAGDGWDKAGPVTGEGGFITKRQNWHRAVGYCGLAGRPA